MQARYHECCGVPTKTLPQKTSQLAITVRYVDVFDIDTIVLFLCTLGESRDNFAESKETLVDFNRLFLGLPLCFDKTLPLRARQIDHL